MPKAASFMLGAIHKRLWQSIGGRDEKWAKFAHIYCAKTANIGEGVVINKEKNMLTSFMCGLFHKARRLRGIHRRYPIFD